MGSAREGTSAAVALRPAGPDDALLLHRWRAEGSVRRFQPLRDLTLAELRAELGTLRPSELWRGRGDRFQWIVVVDGEAAGWITLVIVSWEHGLAELGYSLATRWQGRGLMRAALELLIDDLFDVAGLARLEARCAVGNEASQHVLERLGFHREGLLRAYARGSEGRVDYLLFALLGGERRARRFAAAAE